MSSRVVDLVWKAWTEALPALLRDWDIVRIDRAVGHTRDEGVRWERVDVHVFVARAPGEPAEIHIFRPRYSGSVRVDFADNTVSWSIDEERLTENAQRHSDGGPLPDADHEEAAAQTISSDVLARLSLLRKDIDP